MSPKLRRSAGTSSDLALPNKPRSPIAHARDAEDLACSSATLTAMLELRAKRCAPSMSIEIVARSAAGVLAVEATMEATGAAAATATAVVRVTSAGESV